MINEFEEYRCLDKYYLQLEILKDCIFDYLKPTLRAKIFREMYKRYKKRLEQISE